MTQYLLSVHSGPEDYARSLEEMMPSFEAVAAFNERAREAGIWVFAGGLQPGDLATVVDATGDQPVMTDGPVFTSRLTGRPLLDSEDMALGKVRELFP